METGKGGVVTATPAKPKVACSEMVWGGYDGMHRCSNKASVEHKGCWYCKRHDPVAVAERDRIRKQKWNDEWKAKQKKWKREVAALASFDAARALVEAVLSVEAKLPFTVQLQELAHAWRKAAGEDSNG